VTDSQPSPSYPPPASSESWISPAESKRRQTTGERLTKLETTLGLIKWGIGVLLTAAIVLTALIGVLLRLADVVQR